MAPRKNYTQEQMAKAIEEVRQGQKISAAAVKYGVPRITLYNKITGISPVECNMGPDTILTKEIEMILVKWILYMADNHFPITKDQLLDSVQKIIIEKDQGPSCPFTNKRPGKKWYKSFLKRHPEIAQRTAQNLTKARGDVTEDDLKEWFKTNTDYLKNRGLYDTIMTDPRRIFNTDESAFFLQPKPGRVLVRKGEKMFITAPATKKKILLY
ncbi:unnamed protein product [Parnassius apollo]|uniref:(apollo) hypothetical protein n=1 Tax=Parnassius apollo TaxID=110799 RepID=A0A8S3Y8R9_PARAO|nr:unnamed protein product [Parnassius apollo]